MRKPRISIAALMGAVVLVAVAFASLKEATEAWAGGVYFFTVLVLLTALLGAIAVRGEARFRWAGAAVFGGGYFLLVLSTDVLSPPTLPTARLIGLLTPDGKPVILTGTITGTPGPSQVTAGASGATTVSPAWAFTPVTTGWASPYAVRFQVGHCLFSLAFAFAGSFAARAFRGGGPGSSMPSDSVRSGASASRGADG